MNALYIVIVLQVLDILTTYLCLTKGKGYEANKLLAKLFDKVGLLPGLFLVKGAFITLMWVVAPLIPVETLYVISAGYVWVVYNNLKVLNR
jgi:hypothetical protein